MRNIAVPVLAIAGVIALAAVVVLAVYWFGGFTAGSQQLN